METIPLEAASAVLHPAWCAGAEHDDVGPLDQWHRSNVRVLETVDSRPADPNGVAVSVEQYSARPGGGEWQPSAPTVLMRTLREIGADLTAHEARQFAQMLLSAADVADGLAVTW